MRADSTTGRLFYWLTVAAGLVFAIVPLPGWLETARPDLALLAIIYEAYPVLVIPVCG